MRFRPRRHEPVREEVTDASVDGDVPFATGGARAALSHRPFRIVFWGTVGSNVGTWMQNVVLAAYGFKLTHSTAFVGILGFAQLGPLLFLSTIGGVLADMVDRRKLLVLMNLEQLVFSLVLAALARSAGTPDKTLIVACVFAIGVGNALSAPALSALMPSLVPRRDLPGAVSLQSMQMNASRVVGPAIGGFLYPAFGPAAVFVVNAVTYLFAVLAIAVAPFRGRVGGRSDERPLARLASGFRIVWRDRLLRRIMATMSSFSFFCLAFIGLMPAIADDNLGIDPKSGSYGLLYAGFGLGAALGAVSVGTLFAGRSKPKIVRAGLLAFAVLLGLFGSLKLAGAAYPTVVVLGFAYFAVVTSLSTVLQEHLEDQVRGRVMAVWLMSFGGTVPLGTLAAGPIADHSSITLVLLIGAVWAVVLAWYADLIKVGAPA
jgi:MFS family permease